EEEEEEEDGRGRRVRDPSSIDPSYRISPPGTPKEESKYQDQARHRTPSSSSRRGHPHVSVRYAAPSISPRGKFLRILPVVFVLLLVACLGCIYFLFHIIPLMQGRGGEGSSQHTTDSRYARGLGEGIVFGILLVLQLICFFLAVVTP
ncbi:cell cycle regulator with zn-finger domain-containing protein, partial [Cystoisospora suis]